MKKAILFFIILGLIAGVLTSCKKDSTPHKIKYQITFIQTPTWYQSNFFDVTCIPHYNDEPPVFNRLSKIVEWEYDYWNLTDGDNITFQVDAQLEYYFDMKIFVDNKEVSHKRIKVSDNTYYEHTTVERSGINDDVSDYALITFTYKE